MTSRKTPTELAGFLAKRGVWLLAIEILLVSSTITLTPITSILYGTHIMLFLQTLWAIGTSMIVLAALQFLGAPVCLGLGLVIVLGHNLLDGIWPQNGFGPTELPLWAALHTTMFYSLGPVRILFYYPILPWAGLMLTGFGSAGLFRKLPDQRNALLLKAGLAIVVAFLVLRGLDIYGDPKKWHAVSGNVVASAMSFLNTSKYPPSLLYVLMTLGPAAILCSQADRMRGWLKDTLVMFGRVPFAFYVAHFMLARLMGLLIGEVEGFNFYQMTGFGEAPKHMGVSLGGVYLVWIAVVAMLYPLCRWVAAVKARRSDWWLSYL